MGPSRPVASPSDWQSDLSVQVFFLRTFWLEREGFSLGPATCHQSLPLCIRLFKGSGVEQGKGVLRWTYRAGGMQWPWSPWGGEERGLCIK